MKLLFAGTPVFAQRALAALVAAGHEVVLVLTRPDLPAHRGQQLAASPVKQWALAHHLEVWQPPSLRDPSTWPRLREAGADAMVVAAYGLILPADVLVIPRHGCLNIHASLLPRWRGAAPIPRAIEAGDALTGVTIMQMDAGLDTGAMRRVREQPIGPEDTAATVHDALAELGAAMIVEALAALAAGTLPLVPQPEAGVTYAAKLTKADAPIDWSWSARAIVDRVRAFDPVPGCTTSVERLPAIVLKVWKARAVPRPDGTADAAPGTVLLAGPESLVVACGGGAVALDSLQRPGGRRLPTREFLAGLPLRVGDRLRPPRS
jgi:methionyl-tRNA formyltransferase